MRRSTLDIVRGLLPAARPQALTVALLGLAILAAGFGGEATRLALRYERESVLLGEYWRLLSAHFVHLSWAHLFLNLVGLLLGWLIFGEDYPVRRWGGVFLGSGLAIGFGFLLFDPHLHWYVGLSGVLHGMLAAGLVRWLVSGTREAWWLAALLAAKLVWEQIVGPLPFTEAAAGGPVIEQSHLYGAIGGLVVGLFYAARDRRSDPL